MNEHYCPLGIVASSGAPTHRLTFSTDAPLRRCESELCQKYSLEQMGPLSSWAIVVCAFYALIVSADNQERQQASGVEDIDRNHRSLWTWNNLPCT